MNLDLILCFENTILYNPMSIPDVMFVDNIHNSMAQQAPSEPRSSHCRGCMITLRHIALGRTPLDE